MSSTTVGTCPTTLYFTPDTLEQEFISTLESMGGGFIAFDAEWRFVYANSIAEQIIKVSREQFLGANLWELYPEMQGTRLEEEYRKAAAGEVREFENYYEPVDRWHLIRCIPRTGGGISAYWYDITERKQTEQSLIDAKIRAEKSLVTISNIQKIGATFLWSGAVEPIFETIIEAAMNIAGADFGNIQLVDPQTKELQIVAHNGFPQWWLDYWEHVPKGSGTCGTAFEQGDMVIVEDVETSPIFAGKPQLEIQRRAGVRAVTSMPLVSRSGEIFGMLSIHFKSPFRPDEQAIQMLKLLGLQTTYMIEQQRTQEALHISAEKLSLATEGANIGIWFMDLNTNEIVWSKQCKAHLCLANGTPPSFEYFYSVLHPDDRQRVQEQFEQALATPGDFGSSYRVLQPDGSCRWKNAFGRVYCAADGTPEAVGGVILDVTEQKEAQVALETLNISLEQHITERTRELKESEERYRTVVEGQTEVIARFLPDGTFVFVNEVYCRVFGPKKEDLIGKCWFPKAYEEDLDRITSELKLISPDNPVVTIENRVYDAEGNIRWMQFVNRGFFDASGNLLETQSVGRDITERKQLEEMLILAQASIDGVSDEIHWLTHDARILDVNPAMCRSLGYTREELLQMSILDIDIALDKERFDRVGDNVGSGRPLVFETEHRTKSGQLVPVEVSVNHVQSGDQELICAIARNISERKAMEAALRLSEERYRNLYEHAGDPIIILDRQGNVLSVNQKSCQLYGYSQDEFQAMNIREIDAPEQQALIEYRYAELDEKGFITFEAVHVDAEGRHIEVDVKTVRLLVDDAPCYMSIVRDISERKLLEDTLKSTMTRLELATKSASIGIWSHDFTTGLLKWDQLLCDMYHVPAHMRSNGLTYDFWRSRVHPEDIERVEQRLADSFAHDTTYDDEFRIVLPDGSIRHIHGTSLLIRDTHGSQLFSIGTNTDITDRKHMEEQRRAAEEKLRCICEYHNDAILMIDTEGKISYWNPAATLILGYEADEALGSDLHELLAPERYLAAYREAFPRFRRTGQGAAVGKNVTLVAKRKDGFEFPVELSLSAVTFDGAWQAVGVLRDVTLQKQHEAALEDARRTADKANKAKSEFLSNMSHEIRTPLNGMMLGVQLLEMTTLDDEQQESLTIINSSASSLLSLINDILDLSKIEAGMVELEQIAFNLKACIEGVCRTQVTLAAKKGLQLSVDVSGNIPAQLVGDQLRLKQILMNLISNAIKFTSAGGVSVSAACEELRPGSALVRISVTDTGIGISPDALTKIFDPFTQADTSTTRKFGGTGLGLTICTRLAELLGGTIRVESTQGVGSTFHVQLPYAIAPQPEEDTGNGQEYSSSGPSLRILLAEDDSQNRQLLSRLLARHGHTVIEADTGTRTIELWEQEPVDVILMDIRMPEMDGITAVQLIRRRENDQGTGTHVPVIALTAHAIREERDEIMQHGFDGYLAKPIRLNELLGEMERCCLQGEQGQSGAGTVAGEQVTEE